MVVTRIHPKRAVPQLVLARMARAVAPTLAIAGALTGIAALGPEVLLGPLLGVLAFGIARAAWRSLQKRHVSLTVSEVIAAPAELVTALWRDARHLDRIWQGVARIDSIGPPRLRWVFVGRGGATWLCDVVMSGRAQGLVTWRSMPWSEVACEGSIVVSPHPAGMTVTLRVALGFTSQTSGVGDAVDEATLTRVLARFKRLVEEDDRA